MGVFPIVPGCIAKELKIVVISSLRIGPCRGDEGQPKVDWLLQRAAVRSASSTFTLFRERFLQFLLAGFPLPHTWPGFPSRLFGSSHLSRQPMLNQAVCRWPPALNMLFIVANSCFHDAPRLSWSLYHPKKGVIKYTAFIWVAVPFVIFHLGDAYWRRHVKLQRVFFLS